MFGLWCCNKKLFDWSGVYIIEEKLWKNRFCSGNNKSCSLAQRNYVADVKGLHQLSLGPPQVQTRLELGAVCMCVWCKMLLCSTVQEFSIYLICYYLPAWIGSFSTKLIWEGPELNIHFYVKDMQRSLKQSRTQGTVAVVPPTFQRHSGWLAGDSKLPDKNTLLCGCLSLCVRTVMIWFTPAPQPVTEIDSASPLGPFIQHRR